MSTRTFEHPMQRHPAVAPMLTLIDSAPSVSLGRGGLHALIVQVRALTALERWAVNRFDLEAPSGYAKRLAQRCAHASSVDRYAALPAPLAFVHRADEHDPVLTETARLASTEGPAAARAYVADCRRPSLAARRVAEQGWWPAVEPSFIGRLDGTVMPDDYAASVPLAEALAERRRWPEAWAVTRRLAPRLAQPARRAIVRQQAAAGLTADSVPEDLGDDFRWQAACLAADRQDAEVAQAFVHDLRDPRRRALAAHEVQLRLGQLAPLRAPMGAPWMRMDPDVPIGAALVMLADRAIEAGRPSDAWACLVGAATTPRFDRRYWLEGSRPDLRIAQHLLLVAVKFAHAGRWPWGRRHQRALLDRLDAVLPVVHRVARRQIDEAIETGAVRAGWLKARLRQAVYVQAMEQVDPAVIDHHLANAPRAEAFVRGLLGDRAFGAQLPPDPADPLRELYTDGRHRLQRAARRRPLAGSVHWRIGTRSNPSVSAEGSVGGARGSVGSARGFDVRRGQQEGRDLGVEGRSIAPVHSVGALHGAPRRLETAA